MLQEVMSEFNKVQLEHREHCKTRIKRQYEICEYKHISLWIWNNNM